MDKPGILIGLVEVVRIMLLKARPGTEEMRHNGSLLSEAAGLTGLNSEQAGPTQFRSADFIASPVKDDPFLILFLRS